MNKKQELLRFVSKDKLGLEIAPYFNPLTPRRDGYKCEIIDVFDTKNLRNNAKRDIHISDRDAHNIEEVDHVLDACQIGRLKDTSENFGKYAYIISSHNFEHLPNPILFLQGAYDALEENGVLSMAIPDYRACFDYFRFPTRLSDWLRAYHENHTSPSRYTIFDSSANNASIKRSKGQPSPGFSLGLERLVNISTPQSIQNAYKRFLSPKDTYVDTHCNVLCPEILHLLLTDLQELKLIKFEIISISKTNSFEFYVHLRKSSATPKQSPEQRLALLNSTKDAIGLNGRSLTRFIKHTLGKSKRTRRLLHKITGGSFYLVNKTDE